MAISGGFSSTILNSVFVIQQETVGLGPNIICIKNNGGVGGATITGDTYFKILATGDTGSTTIETSKIIATASTISGTEFGSNLEFWTHPDAIGSISAKRMEIDKNGMLTVYTVDTGDAVTVNGTIVATSNVTTNTGNMYALEGSFISTKSEVSGVPLFGNFQAYQTIDAGDPAHFNFYKTRDGNPVQHNDTIGKMIFYGQDSDGTYIQGGQIRLTVKGTVATNRVGGELSFWTHPDSDSSGTVSLQRVQITNTGGMVILAPDSGVGLTITAGGQTITSGNLVVTAGSITAGTGVTATTGNIVTSAGNIQSSGTVTAGTGLMVTSGTTTLSSLSTGVMQTNVSGVVSSSSGSDGQIIIGALGSAPAWANIVSSDGTVVVTNTPHGIDLGASGGSLVNSITGTANQITASAATGDVTLSVHTTFTGPGYVEATTNFRLPTTTSTAGQLLINGTRFFHAYGTGNLFIGSGSGNFTLSNSSNLGIGTSTLDSLTSGSANVAIGENSLTSVTNGISNTAVGSSVLADNTGSSNVGLGWACLNNQTTANYNIAIGYSAMNQGITTGDENIAIGANALTRCTSGTRNVSIGSSSSPNITTGSYNLLLGDQVASAYATGSESSNILLKHAGVNGESNVMRLGTHGVGDGQVDTTYIAGAITGADSITATTTVTGGTGVTATTGNITATTGTVVTNLFNWIPEEVTDASVQLAINKTYVSNRGTLQTLTLPDTAAFGSVIKLVGKGAGGWLIAQNAAESIHFLGTTTTVGVGGSLASTTQYDCIEIMCTVANVEWTVSSVHGNITVV